MLTITDEAVAKVQELLHEAEPGMGLRLYVKTGGCSGFSYGMSLDHPDNADVRLTLAQGAIPVFVERASLPLLEGSEIDYVDDLAGSGFRIDNPKASMTCGCGASFRTEDDPGVPGSCA
jgi:iron-sulfur cluster assembly protein